MSIPLDAKVTRCPEVPAAPRPGISNCEPALSDCFQRWVEESAQRKSNPLWLATQLISGILKSPPAQLSTSFPSFEMQRLAVPAALRQQIESPDASRSTPVVEGLGEAEMKVPVKMFPVPPALGPPGTWSTENSTSAGAQAGPSSWAHKTNL